MSASAMMWQGNPVPGVYDFGEGNPIVDELDIELSEWEAASDEDFSNGPYE